MKNKLYIFIAIIIVLILSLSGCNRHETTPPPSPTNEKEDVIYFPNNFEKNHIIDADIYDPSDNLAELYTKSHAIVIAKVIDSYDVNYNNRLDFTCSDIKVEKVLKGSLQANQTINIEELGIRHEEYETSIAGVPLLKENMKVLLFLTEPSDVIQGFDAYGVVDCVTGKFFYDNNKTIHPSINFAVEQTLSLSDFKSPQNEVSFLKTIETLSAKQFADK